MTSVAIARWICLVLAVLALLSATVLRDAADNLTVQPWLRLSARLLSSSTEARKPPGLYIGERVFRAWQLLWAALFLSAWWYLGTPIVARTLSALMSPAGQTSIPGVSPTMPASLIAYAAFAFFGFYTFYGLYLDLKLARFHRGGNSQRPSAGIRRTTPRERSHGSGEIAGGSVGRALYGSSAHSPSRSSRRSCSDSLTARPERTRRRKSAQHHVHRRLPTHI